VALHGNKSQNARTRALADFKAGAVEVMVATDIAARGIDIDQLPHVVNFDLPNVPEDYIHRIGRTGRAGADGEAISLVCVDEHAFLRDIERLIKRSIPRQVVPGFEPDPNAVAQTVFTQRGHGQGQGRQPAPSRTRPSPRGPSQPREGRAAPTGRGSHGGHSAKERGQPPNGQQPRAKARGKSHAASSSSGRVHAHGGAKPRSTNGNGAVAPASFHPRSKTKH
jgi:ATP-dependent RNA helicase RhlE